MPAGDAVTGGPTSVTAGSYLDLRPASTDIEWVIHNIWHEGSAELYFYDGTNEILCDSHSSAGGWVNMALHCTYSRYYRVKKTGSDGKISYDGIRTK